MGNPASKLPPVTRILWLLGGLSVLTVFNDPVYLSAVFTVAVFVAIFICGAGVRLFKALPLLLAFIAASLVIWPPFVRSGAEWFSVGPYAATVGGVAYALAMGFRVAGTVVVALGFASSTLPEEFAYGLRAMKVPPAVGFTLSLAFRLLPVMAETTSRVVEAQTARGVTFSGGPVRRIRRYLPLIAPVILLNLRGADQMAVALELRGFEPSRRPVPHNPPRRSAWDVVAVCLLVFLIATALIIRFAGYGAVVPGRI